MKDDISLVVAIAITVFLILGSGLTLIATIGLVRFSNFYKRLHMLSVCTSWGVGSILISSFLYSIFVDHYFVFHEVLLMFFFVFNSTGSFYVAFTYGSLSTSFRKTIRKTAGSFITPNGGKATHIRRNITR